LVQFFWHTLGYTLEFFRKIITQIVKYVYILNILICYLWLLCSANFGAVNKYLLIVGVARIFVCPIHILYTVLDRLENQLMSMSAYVIVRQWRRRLCV